MFTPCAPRGAWSSLDCACPTLAHRWCVLKSNLLLARQTSPMSQGHDILINCLPPSMTVKCWGKGGDEVSTFRVPSNEWPFQKLSFFTNELCSTGCFTVVVDAPLLTKRTVSCTGEMWKNHKRNTNYYFTVSITRTLKRAKVPTTASYCIR